MKKKIFILCELFIFVKNRIIMVNKSALKIMWVILIIVMIAVIAIYAVLFDSLSETEMVQLSFLWSAPLLFSVVGLISAYNGAPKARPYLYGFIAFITAPVLLFFFFEVFWQML